MKRSDLVGFSGCVLMVVAAAFGCLGGYESRTGGSYQAESKYLWIGLFVGAVGVLLLFCAGALGDIEKRRD